MTTSAASRRLYLLLVLALVAGANGCSALNLAGGGLLPMRRAPEGAPPPIDPNVPHVTMEVHAAKGAPQKLHAPLTEPISVQQAVEETGLADRFRRMKITIFRLNPDGSYARMGVRFDKRKGRVESASDYLLHPGDRIMVEEDTTTILDDMMGPWLGPLANAAGV